MHTAFVELEREVGLLLRRSRAISSRLAAELHPDLDGAAYGLLALLQDSGPLRASDLVARLGLDKSTVSRQLASLVALGLVDRTADPDDGRAQVLRPSAEGASRLARAERDVGGDLQRLRCAPGLADVGRELHREAGRVRRGDELLGAGRAAGVVGGPLGEVHLVGADVRAGQLDLSGSLLKGPVPG